MAKIDKKTKTEGPEQGRRIVVAMSGGVDSSVAAALLKQQGYFVVGIFMKFWHAPRSGVPFGSEVGEGNRCCSVESEKLARLVAKQIGIPFYVVNVEKEFKKKVVDYFLKEYKKGNTPNPCVVCNKEIKFGFLIKKALSLGADFVATGHYAMNSLASDSSLTLAASAARSVLAPHALGATSCGAARYASNSLARSNKVCLLKGKDETKDQSYFLWQLSQKQLSHVMFPVGEYTKPEVRKLAKKFKLPTAETPESQEVCFVQNTTNDFLKKYLKTKPGKIIDTKGKVLGKHNGLWFYTIGQRRGLEIQQGPYYVVSKDYKKNLLIVSTNLKDLDKKELVASNVNWIAPQKLPINAEVKIRYKSTFAKAKILNFDCGVKFCDSKKAHHDEKIIKNSKVKIVFVKSQRAITPGQSAVFYKGKELLGGGVIE